MKKLPNIFYKYWPPEQVNPDMPKLGIDWFYRTATHTSRWNGFCITLHFFTREIHINFVSNSQGYANDFGGYKDGPEWDWSLFPAKYKGKLV